MTKRSLSLRREQRAGTRQNGASLTESIIMFPVLFLVGLGIVHLALIAQAKSNLEYAALMAGRIAVASPNFGVGPGGNLLVQEVLSRMRASDPKNTSYSNIVKVCVLRPDKTSFYLFDDRSVATALTIPNDNLPMRDATVRSNGLSIQDANILHLRVSYFFDSGVPLMNMFSPGQTRSTTLPGHSPGHDSRTGSNGIWLNAETALVMQRPASLNSVTTDYVMGAGSVNSSVIDGCL